MKAKLLLMMLLGLGCAAHAADVVEPVAPQFVAISVPDAEASARWYQQVFGLKVLDVVRPEGDHGFAVILTSDALLVEIVQAKGSRSPAADEIENRHLTHGIFKVGFYVADLDAAVASLHAMKARFETGVIDDAKHGFRFVLVRDPDGNTLQLFGKLRAP